MKRILPVAMTVLLLAAGCDTRHESATPDMRDFALSLKVEARGAQVQRVDLPPAALVAIRRADKGDIRVIDAQGRPLSMAFVTPAPAQQNRIRLKAIPFDGPAGGGDRASPVSVRVDQQGSSVRVQADGGPMPGYGSAVLFDTRAIQDSAVSLSLEATVPKQRPVAVSSAAGQDLTVWEPLAEQVLFRPGDGPDLLGGGRIILPPVVLRGRYLRAAWQGEPRLRITGASLVTSSVPPPPRLAIPAKGGELANPHSLSFEMPTGLRPAALQVRMTGKDGVLPVRLLGRDTSELPWTPLAVTSLRQDGAAALLETGDGPSRFLKLEADPRSAGFSQAPAIAVQYAPVTLAIAFNGAGPYRLLVGNPLAKPAAFALSELTTLTGGLPAAQVVGASAKAIVEVGKPASGSGVAPRVVALWSALLAGVALLVYAALRLMRANATR